MVGVGTCRAEAFLELDASVHGEVVVVPEASVPLLAGTPLLPAERSIKSHAPQVPRTDAESADLEHQGRAPGEASGDEVAGVDAPHVPVGCLFPDKLGRVVVHHAAAEIDREAEELYDVDLETEHRVEAEGVAVDLPSRQARSFELGLRQLGFEPHEELDHLVLEHLAPEGERSSRLAAVREDRHDDLRLLLVATGHVPALLAVVLLRFRGACEREHDHECEQDADELLGVGHGFPPLEDG